MKIEIYGSHDMWWWELRDKQGHPVCKSAPRHGDYYHSKASCIASAGRFYDILRVGLRDISIWHGDNFLY